MAAGESCAAHTPGTARVAAWQLSAARCGLHVAALLALTVRCSGQAGPAAGPAQLWAVKCSMDCDGVNTCSGACQGEQSQIGKCPEVACPKPDANLCAAGPVPCQFSDWSDWAEDIKCTGLCTRTRSIPTPNKCGGTPCQGSMVDTKRCHSPCNPPQDCIWSAWAHWGDCGTTVPNQRERSRKITRFPKSGGAPCEGHTLETKACGQALSSGIDCQMNEWMDWAACDQECGGGQKIRFRTIVTQAFGGGKACPGSLSQTEGCNPDPCLVGNGWPADCTFAPWTVWTSCGGGNQKHRQRVVQAHLQNKGKACEGTLAETQSCGAKTNSEQDCLLSEWSHWTLCTKSCDGGQTYRERSIEAEPRGEGKACKGALKETRECAAHPCDLGGGNGGCALSQWSEWSICTGTCGVGSQQRSRDIVAQAHSGGKGCSLSLAQTRGCPNLPTCSSTDCMMTDWGAWTACDKTCGGGESRRTRSIAHDALPGGKVCSPGKMAEYEPCNDVTCPTECIDALWGDWGGWSFCTKSCKGGYQYRKRRLTEPGNTCGNPAVGKGSEYKTCNDDVKCTVATDVDCQLGDWQDWSSCSSTCLGVRKRSRQVAVHGSGHGLYCGSGKAEPLTAVESCGRPSGFGQAYLTDEEKHYLSVCGLTYPQDCVLGDWGFWSLCSLTCAGGQRTRERKIMQKPAGTGKQCEEALAITEPCNTATSCEGELTSNCTMSDWSMWGACEGCTGQRYRTRSLIEEPAGGGNACDEFTPTETGGCEQHCQGQTHSPFFCIWTAWTHWSDCSETCGNGFRTRSEMMAGTDLEPTSYAALAQTAEECYGERHERGSCNLEDCPVCVPRDCKLGDWSLWGPATCEGLAYRNRSVVVQPNECGKPCDGSLRGTMQAWPTDFTHCEPRDCQISDWGGFGFCDSSSSQTERKREIKVFPTRDGEACVGSLSQTESCLSVLHPEASTSALFKKDCVFSPWTDMGECSHPCGGGQQLRARKVVSEAKDGGEACHGTLNEIGPCNLQKCPGDPPDADCKFGPWSVWHGCNKTAGHFQAYRKRHVLHGPVGLGKPCDGDTRETKPCPGLEIIDCELSPWTGWSACSWTCFGGTRQRARTVINYASDGGKLCSGDLLEMEPCNSDVSCGGPQDCQLESWSMWSPCVVAGDAGASTCGDGHKVRRRRIMTPGDPGGKTCETALEEVTSCKATNCPGQKDCKWQAWENWQPCVKAEGPCGVGYKRRTRAISQLPVLGGRLCKPEIKDQLMPEIGCQGQLQCCIDGKWGEWGPWSSCSATCGGSTRKRTRLMARNATWCGKVPDGADIEFDFCQTPECSKTDCKFGDWGPWTPDIQVHCPGKCDSGHVERNRAILTPATRSGEPCTGHMHEWKRCPYDPSCGDTHPPGKDCLLGDWQPWGPCSRSCEGGYQERVRAVMVYPEYGGADCPSNSLQEVRGCFLDLPCNPGGSKVNCLWSAWTMWSGCENGEMTSTRDVQIEAANGGDPCTGPQTKSTGCATCINSTYYCQWSTWGDWGACSQTCGTGGKRVRKRHLQVGGAGTMQAFNLPRMEAQVARVGRSHVKDLAIAFGAGAGVLLLMIALRPLMQTPVGEHIRSRTVRWLGIAEGQAPSASSEVGASADPRDPGDYAPLPLQHAQLVEEGAAE